MRYMAASHGDDLFDEAEHSIENNGIHGLRESAAPLTILFFSKKIVVSLIHDFARSHTSATVLIMSGPVRRKSVSDSSCRSDSLAKLIVLKSFSH